MRAVQATAGRSVLESMKVARGTRVGWDRIPNGTCAGVISSIRPGSQSLRFPTKDDLPSFARIHMPIVWSAGWLKGDHHQFQSGGSGRGERREGALCARLKGNRSFLLFYLP